MVAKSTLENNFSTALNNLGANENPYGPSEKARIAISNDMGASNRYPSKLRAEFQHKIARKFRTNPLSVVLGAGSSELLQLLACWCVRENHVVTTAELTFDILPDYIKRFGGEVLKTPMTDKKGLDLTKIELVAKRNPGVVYLVNPNNPTGSKLPYNDLKEFCKRVSEHSYVIIDEAYIEYVGGDESMAPLIRINPKVIVVRTFSKIYGLAGLRVGYLLATPETAAMLRSYQIWKGAALNNLGIVAASESLDAIDFVERSRLKNQEVRKYTLNELRKIGKHCITPHANFIWFRCDPVVLNIAAVYAKNDIKVGTTTVDGETWMRVTMGTRETMQHFVRIAKAIWT